MCDSCGCHNHDEEIVAVSLPVKGMSCQACAKRIQNALNELEGVQHAQADFGEGFVSLELTHDGNLQKVKDAIHNLGYEA